jgi:hypothetical protein
VKNLKTATNSWQSAFAGRPTTLQRRMKRGLCYSNKMHPVAFISSFYQEEQFADHNDSPLWRLRRAVLERRVRAMNPNHAGITRAKRKLAITCKLTGKHADYKNMDIRGI